MTTTLVEQTEEWRGLRPGDTVRIRGQRGTFTFRYARHDQRMTQRLDGRPCEGWSVTVTGGVNTTEWRTFYAEDVVVAKAKPQRPSRSKPGPKPRRAQRSEGPPPTMLTCRQCSAEFPRPVTRGRPPHRCPSCRGASA